MTQTFIGYKPGVGPVLKCLKYDTDDPLTLANTAFDRFFFNSETQNLSYVFTTNGFYYRAAEISALPTSFNISNNLGNTVITGRYGEASTFYNVTTYYKIASAYPSIGYVPLSEFRTVNLLNNRVECGSFYNKVYVADGGHRIVDAQQFYTIMGRCTGYISNETTMQTVYAGQISSTDSGRVGVGEWFVWERKNVYKDNRDPNAFFPNVWDLPADSSPMRAYNYVENLEAYRSNPSEFILARPGFDVNTTNEFGTIISSRNRSPALCVMNGVRNSIPINGSVTIPAPPGVILSQRAVADVMFRVSGQTWCVPGLLSDTTEAGKFVVSYEISNNAVTFYNSHKDVIDIRYVVFNVDDFGTSTGGNQVMFRGNDGAQDFVQIKKPGTSDPASRPNDILFDSRFPQFQIIAQGFIPIGSFSNSSTFGSKTYRLNFNNAGFVPFLKYSIVFPNCVTTPMLRYEVGTGGGMANIAVRAHVSDTFVDFFCQPDSGWSDAYADGSSWKKVDYGAPMQGVRYYIFGIAQ